MKKQIFNILLFSLLICFAGNIYGQSAEKIKEEKIKVGFHCPNGKNLIETSLIKAVGVKEVVADLETKIVTIKFDGNLTNREQLVKELEKTGYTTEDTKPGTTINKACTHEQPQN